MKWILPNLKVLGLCLVVMLFGQQAWGQQATKLVITTISPASPTAGGTFTVTVRSQNNGNNNTNVNQSTSFTLSTNGNAGVIGGTVTGTINNGSSTATVTGVSLPNAATGVTLTATRNPNSGMNLTAGTSAAFTVIEAPTKFVITSISPASPTEGANFSVTIQAQNSTNAQSTVLTNTAFSLSTNGNGGTIGGTTTGTINAGSSSVTITGVNLSTAGTGVTLTAARTSGDNLTDGTSSAFTVVQSTATKLIVTNITPASPTQGTAFSVTIQSADANNNLRNVTANTNFTLSASGGGNPISGTTTGTIVSGTNSITLTGVILANSGTTTLTATRTSGGNTLTAGTSSITVLQSIATNLSINNIGTSPTEGVGFSITVRSQDAAGNNRNVVAATNFTITTNGNAGVIGGTVTGTIPAGTSTATVTGIILPTAGTGVTLTVTQTAGDVLASDVSNTFTVITAASKFAITTITPTSPTEGVGFSITVRSQDAAGNNRNVVAATNFTITTNGNAGVIGGTVTGTIPAGTSTATVTGIILPTAGTGVTLTATQTSGDNLTAGTSSLFNVIPGTTITSTTTGGNWNSTSTWVGGVVPTSLNNVVIANGATVTINATASCANLTVGQGTSGILQYETGNNRTLTVSGDVTITSGGTLRTGSSGSVNDHQLSIGGDLTNNGTLNLTLSNAATILNMNGSSAQTISNTGTISTIRSLIINNTNGVTLSNTSLTAVGLTLTTGKLTLGANDLTINTTITGGSSSAYIVTDGTGSLKRLSVASGTTGFFPVGTASSYNPVTITNGGNTTYAVNVNTTTPSGGTLQAAKILNRTWNIVPTGTPTNVVLRFGYNAGEGGTDFNASPTATMDALHLISGSWVNFNSATPTGGGPYAVTFTNAGNTWSTSSFSFGLAGVLPIELASIAAKSQKSQNLVIWQTVSEKNVAQFEILRASNPQADWSTIGTIKAIGNSQTEQKYEFVDNTPLSISYYRLRSVDLDGKESLSNIVSVQQNNNSGLKAYPTMVTNKLNIQVENDETQTYNIFDLYGKNVQTGQFNGQKELFVQDLSNGIYIVKVGQNSVKFLKN